ncbi:Os03g0730950 [Oryza sativa Japonica Group]|uniref:Os03g0730950 protein n=1 Tax=Oryza sativa subsp. japonica TaxID=39947 RepID=A0A0P0W2K5_ORYSJ|nr:Os03g0730950 [Oryza sativa Japonica Group]
MAIGQSSNYAADVDQQLLCDHFVSSFPMMVAGDSMANGHDDELLRMPSVIDVSDVDELKNSICASNKTLLPLVGCGGRRGTSH